MAALLARSVFVALVAAVVSVLSACGTHASRAPSQHLDASLADTRATTDTPIDAAHVARLRVRWRFPFRAPCARTRPDRCRERVNGPHALERRFPSPDLGCAAVANDVCFTSTYDGTVYGLAARDGRVVWRARMRAGVNACPAVSRDLVLFDARVRRHGAAAPELVAFALR